MVYREGYEHFWDVLKSLDIMAWPDLEVWYHKGFEKGLLMILQVL